MNSKVLAFLIGLAVACYFIGVWSADYIGHGPAVALSGVLFVGIWAVYDVIRHR
jgi:hypothetical protein